MFMHDLLFPYKHQRIRCSDYISSILHFCCLIFQIGCLDEEMDSCDSYDGVEEEKVNLLGRYDLFLGIANLFQLIEFFIAIALISWSLFRLSSVLKVSGDNLLTFSSNLFSGEQIERFRRTQSEKLKREMSIKPHRELRRSATAERSSVDERSTAVSSEMVEMMSSEEFQLAVESFISKQQSFLKQEGLAESGNNCNKKYMFSSLFCIAETKKISTIRVNFYIYIVLPTALYFFLG
ncbi:hypothetical protein L1987_80348 [Smallanthus sonchifolius]|uniref:Uncharacterized protein n=1 Tax=Smallanthus sonchifolius TaxID=185202 RepID=A0ACB8YRM9_9ASTR|nr:hypothetical protein L1987_80348 [Smallanthus sonchifolius]